MGIEVDKTCQILTVCEITQKRQIAISILIKEEHWEVEEFANPSPESNRMLKTGKF